MHASGLWLALVAAALFGVSGVVAADAFDAVTPVQMTQFRSVVTAVILGVLVLRRRRPGAVRSAAGRLGLLGVALAAVTVTYYVAIDRLGVGPGVTLQFLGPALVLVWMRVAQRRAVPGAAWAAAAVAVGGTALMTGAWDIASVDAIGVLAGLGAAVSLATYLVVGESLGRSLSALSIAAYGFGVSALIWLVAAPVDVPVVSSTVWAQMVWVAVAGTAVPFLLEVAALRRADPGRVGVVATSEPVVAAAVAWPVLGQALTPTQVGGGMLVVTSVAMIQWITASGAAAGPDAVARPGHPAGGTGIPPVL